MNPEYIPHRGGMTCTVGFDPITGEALEPVVAEGHDPHSVFEGEIERDYFPSEEPQDIDDQIADSIRDLYPVDQILDYVTDTYDESFYEAYDKAVDEGNWAYVYEFLDRMVAEMETDQPQADASHEEIVKELDDLAETEALGTETAFEYLQMAEQATDPIEKEMLMLTASFHRNEIDAESAIQSMLSKYDINTLRTIYNKLNT